MTLNEIYTPAIVLDLDRMENNLKHYAALAARHGKQLWPMVKTHKSTELAQLQKAYGCTGFLCGTLDECEALADAGLTPLMYAYPVGTEVSACRAAALAARCAFYLRLDCLDAAPLLNACAAEAGTRINYTLIVDSGLHRFGVRPEDAAAFVEAMDAFPNLVFKGVSTHPGHVYAASDASALAGYAADETRAVRTAAAVLRAAGRDCEILSSGSTPTFRFAVADEAIQIYHPGNYIFNDAIQLSTQTASEDDCALYVLASVISHPREGLFICDAGAKCLGLDQGAHGNTAIRGHGLIVGHPELTLFSLSEEVGKLHAEGETALKVGDKIRIIPNHSCSAANLTDYYIGVRGDTVERLIRVDIRGNATRKNVP